MNIRQFMAMGFALFAALCIANHCLGCASAKSTEAELTYIGQQLKCVDKYDTKPEIDACRRIVKSAWAKDGGAE